MRWVVRQRMVTVLHVSERFAMNRPNASVRLRVLVEHGLLHYDRLFSGDRAIYRATAKAIRLAGRRGDSWPLGIASARHDLELTWIAMELEREFGVERVITGPDMRAGGVRFGYGEPGRYADLAVRDYGEPGRFLAVEYERAIRTPKALERMLGAYLNRHVGLLRLYASDAKVERSLRVEIDRHDSCRGFFELRPWSPPAVRAEPARRTHGRTKPARDRPRAPRQPRLTTRDLELLKWLGRQRMATVEQLETRFGLSRAIAYRRLAALRSFRAVAHERILHRTAGVYSATGEGLKLAGLPYSAKRGIALATYAHDLELTTLCIELEREFGAERVLTERDLRHAERAGTEPRFAPYAGVYRRRRHYPDLAVEGYQGELPLLVEFERVPKARAELDPIIEALGWARHVAAVRYYACDDSVERALRASIGRVLAPSNGSIEIRRRELGQAATPAC